MKKVIKRTVRGSLHQKFLVQASGNDALKVQLLVCHDRPNTDSRVAICVIAEGHAQVTVDATVTIKSVASMAQAQLDLHVITRDRATVNAAPNLEIHNHNVKARHSLTTKHITEKELFYLMSRGLSRIEAEKLVLDSFMQPFLDESTIKV